MLGLFGPAGEIFRLISDEATPFELGSATALGLVLGLTPLFSPHQLVVLMLLFVFRVNLAMFLLSASLFASLAILTAPIFHEVGNWILHYPDWQQTFTAMYNSSFWRWFPFNNTVAMGSVAVTALLIVPVTLMSGFLASLFQRLLHWLVIKVPGLNHVLKLGKVAA